ncbi:ABC transporter permease [Propionicicella superfundia]|uniref:ABC transporter permease n=1 Tax=Propionicicella superfundia TaxID=348582 RepID=UPI000404D4C5|nr:ABC transporter permease [Propionicicella superfundia]
MAAEWTAAELAEIDISPGRRASWRLPGWLVRTARRPHGVFGLVVVAAVLIAAAVSLVWTPHPLLAADSSHTWAPPSWTHPLGTDQIGRDTASWLLAGARTTVLVAAGATAIAALVGLALGTLTASLRPRFAEPLVVLVDILVAFPVLLIAMLLATPFGGSIGVVVVAVGIGYGVNLARVVRSEIVRVNASDYILAARAAGTGLLRRLWLHVLPNVVPVLVVQLSLTAGVAILAESGLTFLGYGAAPAEPSWGRVLADAQKYIGVAPLSVVWPGVAIGVTVLALNLLGDAVAEALDPRLRSQEARDGA